jgi:DNA-binding MarR family transcriptional regulator
MSLVEMIDSLIDDTGKHRLNEGTIRSRLLSLREQAEAIDLDLQRTRVDLKRLKKYAKAEEIVSKQDSLKEIAVKLLQLLSCPQPPSLEQMTRELGIKQVEAQYHADMLLEKGLIEPVAYLPGKGMIYVLTAKGTAYVVENDLV